MDVLRGRLCFVVSSDQILFSGGIFFPPPQNLIWFSIHLLSAFLSSFYDIGLPVAAFGLLAFPGSRSMQVPLRKPDLYLYASSWGGGVLCPFQASTAPHVNAASSFNQ